MTKGIAAVRRGLKPIIGIRLRDVNHGIPCSGYYASVLFPAISADLGAQIADIPPRSTHAHSELLYMHAKSTILNMERRMKQVSICQRT